MSEKQNTIRKTVSITGKGLHTGKEVTLTLKAAAEDEGIRFFRVDLPETPVIHADVDNVIDTSRGTTLEENGVSILTADHLLAAVYGSGIDNLNIETDNEEIPIFDGSSRYFLDLIERGGIVEQSADRIYFKLHSNLSFVDPINKVELLAVPSDTFRISVMIDYDSNVIVAQHAYLENIRLFKEEIGHCRTFVFLHELEELIRSNLIKGGDLDNAIIFVDKLIEQVELDRLADFFQKPRVKVLSEGILNNVDLYFPNEPARHKLLDLIGDLSLIGTPVKAHIIAKRPGHYSNIQFARIIKQHIKAATRFEKAPYIDPNKPPLFDINEIQNILPHRPPFLLVDRIIEMTDRSVIALKNVTINEAFFMGHFPEEPVMPGVLQIEAMAQSGGILALCGVSNPKDYTTLFLKIEKVKFRHKVVPGDTLVFKLELASPIRRGICHMRGLAFVGERVVAEAELMAQITLKK